MSASLVGSEMWYKRQPPGVPRDKKCVEPKPSPATSSRWRRARPATVSYTHLTLPTICSV
eukprot:5676569-Alexandrium_andersonii.AAC.1